MKAALNLNYSKDFTDIRKLDMFLPTKANGRAIFFVHGGGWQKGSREQWHPVAKHFCNMGYVCCSASYRLAPKYIFPAQIEDVRLAFAWFKSRSSKFGFSSDKIASLGSSAGGHLVGLLSTIQMDDELGFTDELVENRPSLDTVPNATIAYCPVMNFITEEDKVSLPILMGKEKKDAFEEYRKASPIEKVSGKEPPFLFIHGDTDETVLIGPNSIDMSEKLNAHGIKSNVLILKNAEHGFGYGVTTEFQKTSIKAAEDFINNCF